MQVNEISPDYEKEIDRIVPESGRQDYNFLDLIKIAPDPGRPGLLKYNVSRLRKLKAELRPGIYIWSHPDWGIFYIGINAKGVKGAEQRWLAHADKLLNRLRASTGYTRGWHEFSDLFVVHSREDILEAEKDLEQVTITYLPLREMASDPAGYKVLKKELASIEDQLIDFFNPFANKEYRYTRNQNKPSKTLNVPSATELSTRFSHLVSPSSTIRKKSKSINTKMPRSKTNSISIISQAQELKDRLLAVTRTPRVNKEIQRLDTYLSNTKIAQDQNNLPFVVKRDIEYAINRANQIPAQSKT